MHTTVLRSGVLAFLLAAVELGAQQPDSVAFIQLESEWNAAHLRGDTVTLNKLWADVLIIEVPQMPVMSKADALAFWRLGHSNITRYETSGLQIQVEPDSVLVRGRLFRERDFNGRVVEDRWAFLKVYRRIDGRWQVTAYRASEPLEAAESRLGSSAKDSSSARGVPPSLTEYGHVESRGTGHELRGARAAARLHDECHPTTEGAF